MALLQIWITPVKCMKSYLIMGLIFQKALILLLYENEALQDTTSTSTTTNTILHMQVQK